MNLLLITGTIQVHLTNDRNVKIVNAEIRLKQYLDSIDFAINNYTRISHIVFCENSNYQFDYSEIINRANDCGKILEVISFNVNLQNLSLKGKGYGEGEIIKYAFLNSKYLKNCDFFYKLTGRLCVLNFDKIVRYAKNKSYFIFYPAKVYSVNHDCLSTVFYKVNTELYQTELLNVHYNVDDNNQIYLEHLFLSKMSKYKIRSFSVFPKISGLSGSSGLKYDISDLKYVFELLSNLIGIHNINYNIFTRVLVNALSKLKKIFNKYNS